MRAVSIDGELATVGAGARLGAVYDALAADGRAIPGGSCPPVGIAGLTLGGGLGILGRSYGVTSDRLVAAEVVLADGRVIVCDDRDVDRSVPHGPEAVLIVRGRASALRPTSGLTGLPAALPRATGTMSPASEAGAMTANPCDRTATAQEECR